MTIFDVSPETGRSSLLQDPQVASRIGLKVRGQSSSGDPKTPYRLETRDQHDQDWAIAPLGLTADADWVLHGPWSDRTLVHNSIAYELGAEIGLDSPRTRYVELFRNQNGGDLEADDYLGLYLLIENIKRGENRVDIPELDPGQLKPDEISGGYILRFEQEVSEARDRLEGWRHLELLDGQKYSPEQKAWITDYVNQADAAIARAETSRDYEQLIEVDSFVDSLIIHELGRDQDAYVRSYYLYKDRGGKLVAGPLWDFNLIWNRGCCFDNRNPSGWQFDQTNPGRPTGWNKGDHNWNGKLMDSWDFSQRFIDRWTELRQEGNLLSLDNLMPRIDRHVAELGEAVDRNFQRWPNLLTNTSGFPGPRFPTHQEHIDDMKNWINTRVEWIDSQFRSPPVIQPQNGTVELVAAEGTAYYTLDGSDPFDSSTGEPSANAIAHDGRPVVVADGTLVIARVRDTTVDTPRTEMTKTQWSAPVSRIISDATPASAENLKITELNYNPYDALPQFGELDVDNDEFEFVEVQNVGEQTIDLTGVRFVETGQGNDAEGVVFDFAPQLLQPSQSLVVVRNQAAFLSRYGTDVPIALGDDGTAEADGQFGGRLSNEGESVSLHDSQGHIIQAFRYSDSGDWSARADGRGSSLEVIDVLGDLSDFSNWRPSQTFSGTPGAPAAEPVVDVVINELLANSDLPLVDRLELFNSGDQAVDLNRWYASDTGRNLLKFQFSGADTVIQPGSYRVFDETQLGFGFKGQADDDVWLVEADGQGRPVRFADQIEFGPTETDVSLGRWPNGSGPLVPMQTRTFGAENSGPRESLAGDLNSDGRLDVEDIQFMCAAIHSDDRGDSADLDGDGQVNHDDLTQLVIHVLGSRFGDANLDGTFNSTDLVVVFEASEYEDGIVGNSTWSEGDWNCDGEFDTGDFVVAFQDGGYTAAAAAVRHSRPAASPHKLAEELTGLDVAARLVADDLISTRIQRGLLLPAASSDTELKKSHRSHSQVIDFVLSDKLEFLESLSREAFHPESFRDDALLVCWSNDLCATVGR